MRVALGGKSSQIMDDPIDSSNAILTTPSRVKQNNTVLSTEPDGRNSSK